MRPSPVLRPAQAALLGLMHGPAELLPVSSSAHTAMVPSLLGWRYGALDGPTRKTFEVALHAGTAIAYPRIRPRPALLCVATLPAVLAGLMLEDPVERRLGGRRATAVGLVAGALISLVADAKGRGRRGVRDATLADAAVIGVAQACALVPGLSRAGMTIAAAQARGFSREAAWAISREIALPVVAGAAALKAARLSRTPVHPDLRASFAIGALAAAASARAARPLAGARPALPFAAERAALAVAVLWKDRRR